MTMNAIYTVFGVVMMAFGALMLASANAQIGGEQLFTFDTSLVYGIAMVLLGAFILVIGIRLLWKPEE